MKRIIGYVNTADLNHMREEDVRALTVINIAFGLIRDGEVVWDAKDARDGIVSIRKSNPELKIVLSVGGWGADGFSQAARTKEGRERFAASALAIVKEYGLDGIDIDWEYPGTSLAGIASDRSDKENYTLLLAELRKTLGRVQRRHACNDSSRRRCLLCTADRYEGGLPVSGLCAADDV